MQPTRFEGMMLSILFPDEPADATTRETETAEATSACRLGTMPISPVRTSPKPHFGAKDSPRRWVCPA